MQLPGALGLAPASTAQMPASSGRDGNGASAHSGEGGAQPAFARLVDARHPPAERAGAEPGSASDTPAEAASPGTGVPGAPPAAAPPDPAAEPPGAVIARRASAHGAASGGVSSRAEGHTDAGREAFASRVRPAGTSFAFGHERRAGQGPAGLAGPAGGSEQAGPKLAASARAQDGRPVAGEGTGPKADQPGGLAVRGSQQAGSPLGRAAPAPVEAAGSAGSGVSGAPAGQPGSLAKHEARFQISGAPGEMGSETAGPRSPVLAQAPEMPSAAGRVAGRQGGASRETASEIPLRTVQPEGAKAGPPAPFGPKIAPMPPGPGPNGGEAARRALAGAAGGLGTAAGEGPGAAAPPSAAMPPVQSTPHAASTAAQGAGGSESARALTSQVAGAIVAETAPARLEVRLDPPELGRLEISLEIVEQSLRATVAAERSGTQDLLRRHADLLLSQLHQAGFSGVDLRFAGGREGAGGEGNAATAGAASGADADGREDAGPATPDPVARGWRTEGLDLRF